MITITRRLARQFRAAMRRARLGRTASWPDGFIHFAAGSEGLRIRVASLTLALEYRQSEVFPDQDLWLPVHLLEVVAGRTDDIITLEADDKYHIRARWSDRGIPQLVNQTLEPPQTVTWPELPKSYAANPPQLWSALRDGVGAAARDRLRYALDCVQLRGSAGQIVATDGHHVLVQGGFELPRPEDLLVPASPILGWKDIAPGDVVNVGSAGDWINFASGPWTVSLLVEKDNRYPEVEGCFPQVAASVAQLEISDADAVFLERTLPSLPCDDEQYRPATLDLNGQVIVRGRGEGQNQPTDLVLTGSRLEGEPVAVNTSRQYLAHALALGFRRFALFGPQSPILAESDERRYLWAVLDAESAIKPASDAIRIESTGLSPPVIVKSSRCRKQNMSKPESSAAAAASESPPSPAMAKGGKRGKRPRAAIAGPAIEQAVALRTALLAAVQQTNELLRALKQQRRQDRLVASTLASLREIQKEAG